MAADTAAVTFRKTTWEFDPNWVRVEALDPAGESLGVVTFEPRAAAQDSPAPASSGVWAQMSRISAGFRSIVRRLRPSAAASSALS